MGELPPALSCGARCIWRREARGGYGYVQRIPVVVLKVGKRVRVHPLDPDTGDPSEARAPRNVTPERLAAPSEHDLKQWPFLVPEGPTE